METKQEVALKLIKHNPEEGVSATTMKEISILKMLIHPNIVKFHTVLHHKLGIFMIFDFISTDLQKLMTLRKKEGQTLSPEEIKSFTFQMLNGVYKCHQHDKIHRDLKPQNLLITKDEKQLQLADFGLARSIDLPISELYHEVVTQFYRPPDLLMGNNKYGKCVDIWSAGCVFAEMAIMKPLFMINNLDIED
jgi:serine/threonine protein kinase